MRRLSIVLTRLATAAVISALALLAVAPAASAAGPTLVRDINPTGSSDPTHLTVVGSTLFFAANDGIHGNELWKSDGTAAGTKMVKNIRPLGKSSDPENLVNVNGTLFFTAIDGKHGRELWKSDGTKAGTRMVMDLNTGKKNSYGGNSTYLHEGGAFAVGNQLFFLVDWCCIGTSGLYVSDGTAAGTKQLLDGDDVYFELPETASAGTAGGKFYFVSGFSTDTSFEWQLWVSDGTDAGTHRVPGSPAADVDLDLTMGILPTNGQKLYFHDGGRLWRTNGTAAGTKPLTSIGELASAPTESVLLNGRLYFNGGGLWKTDGTAAGTTLISSGEVKALVATSNRVFFLRGTHLWKSDGTVAGTTDLGVFGGHDVRAMVAVGNKVCFVDADWGNAVWTLWESSGTTAGTYQVLSFDILGGGFSTGDGPIGTAVGSSLFFSAAVLVNGVHGSELLRYTP